VFEDPQAARHRTAFNTRDELIETVALIWAQSIANQAARTPEEAAKAAGCRTEKAIAAWIEHSSLHTA